jgi:PAS domain S-box-containing protein
MPARLPRALRWSSYSLRTKGLIVVALPVLPLVLFWSIIAASFVRRDQPTDSGARTLIVQARLARVVSTLLDADTGARDYLLTDNAASLARYQTSVTRVPASLAELDNAVINDGLRALLRDLHALVDDELSVLARLANGPATGEAWIGERELLDRSVANIDRIRTLATTIELRQAALAALRTEQSQRSGRVLFYMLLVGSIACVGGGVLASLAVAGSLSRRLRLLSRNADRLARGDAIEVLPGGDDEIARLDERFRSAAGLLRQREDELRRSGQMLDSFFNLSHDLFCIVGFDGCFRRVNPAWEATLGVSPIELQAAPMLELLHPDDRARTETAVASLVRGVDVVDLENRYRCRDGSYRWLRWNARPRVAEGLIFASARDVTDRTLLHQALNARTAELEAANRELEAFSYSVSHDLRAPLRAIDGFSEAIEREHAGGMEAAGRDALRRVRAAARRMGALIDGLLNLSRLTRSDLRREHVDLGAAAAGIVADLARRGPDRAIDVRIAPDLVVDADPQMVRIALQNLLDNAWKYTGRQARACIEIGSTPNGSARVFHVRDNGAGFDMKYAGKLFGAFQRLHSEREFEGTGIGLATVQRIVARHGGRIWAEGRVDAGATFYFTLEPENTTPA